MSVNSYNDIRLVIDRIVHGAASDTNYDILREQPLPSLPVLSDLLLSDLDIETLEKYEYVLKFVLSEILKSQVTGEEARLIARFQQKLGFLLKYKPYAIKCATPLGYSVFLQNDGEGFSFQRHITHKTEVFHILQVQDASYIFICDFADWSNIYTRRSFQEWLEGKPDAKYDQYKYKPRPGDVIVIDRLNVVHTVVGCILEEFATVSTDMVDRLYDQNSGIQIPGHFDRGFAKEKLSSIHAPITSQRVNLLSRDRETSPIEPVRISGGYLVPIARTAISASRYIVDPRAQTDIQRDELLNTILFINSGVGDVIIGDEDEIRVLTPPSIPVRGGDVLMIPPGIWFAFANSGDTALEIAEHRIRLDVAFVRE